MLPSALIVGPGSVGQSLGYWFTRAKINTTFLVRTHHPQTPKHEFKVRELRSKPLKSPEDFVSFFAGQVHISTSSNFDQDIVILTLSSDKIRDEALVQNLAKAIKPSTLVLSLQPLPADRAFLEKYFSKEQLVSGVIHWIAWPNGNHSTELFVPPLSAMWLNGEQKAVAMVQAILVKAGISTQVLSAESFQGRLRIGNAAMMIWIAALELSDWSINALLKNRSVLKNVFSSGQLFTESFFARALFTREFLATLNFLAQFILPFKLEPYLKSHFTKVRPQTLLALQELAQSAKDNRMDPAPIESIRTAISSHLTN